MNKKYWLKGGGWGIFAMFLASLLGYTLTSGSGCSMLCGIGFVLPLSPILTIYNKLHIDTSTNNMFGFLLTIILGVGLWFFVGIILGWLYGKIKNRNKMV